MRSSAEAPAAGKSKPQLILWPETSVPFLFTDRPDALAAIGAMLTDGQMLMAGAVRSEGGRHAEVHDLTTIRWWPSTHGGEIVDAVDKVHLVPFGEYLPFAELLDRHRPQADRRRPDEFCSRIGAQADQRFPVASLHAFYLLRDHFPGTGCG